MFKQHKDLVFCGECGRTMREAERAGHPCGKRIPFKTMQAQWDRCRRVQWRRVYNLLSFLVAGLCGYGLGANFADTGCQLALLLCLMWALAWCSQQHLYITWEE